MSDVVASNVEVVPLMRKLSKQRKDVGYLEEEKKEMDAGEYLAPEVDQSVPKVVETTKEMASTADTSPTQSRGSTPVQKEEDHVEDEVKTGTAPEKEDTLHQADEEIASTPEVVAVVPSETLDTTLAADTTKVAVKEVYGSSEDSQSVASAKPVRKASTKKLSMAIAAMQGDDVSVAESTVTTMSQEGVPKKKRGIGRLFKFRRGYDIYAASVAEASKNQLPPNPRFKRPPMKPAAPSPTEKEPEASVRAGEEPEVKPEVEAVAVPEKVEEVSASPVSEPTDNETMPTAKIGTEQEAEELELTAGKTEEPTVDVEVKEIPESAGSVVASPKADLEGEMQDTKAVTLVSKSETEQETVEKVEEKELLNEVMKDESEVVDEGEKKTEKEPEKEILKSTEKELVEEAKTKAVKELKQEIEKNSAKEPVQATPKVKIDNSIVPESKSILGACFCW